MEPDLELRFLRLAQDLAMYFAQVRRERRLGARESAFAAEAADLVRCFTRTTD